MQVAVFAGGRSPEHDISLSSASQVLQHLDRERYTVWPVLLQRDGMFRPARRPLRSGGAFSFPDTAALLPPMRAGRALDWLLDDALVDVVLPVLHGPHGEDGTVQGMLELAGIPFVGSGCSASAVAMDKLRTRQVFASAGLPIAASYEPEPVGAWRDPERHFAAIEAVVGLPAFVKGDLSGSTVGVVRVRTVADLREFFAAYEGTFRRWFAERAVAGEEITVAVLGNTGSPLQPLPPVGIYPVDDDWFTHDAKYRPGATEEIVPPRGLDAAAIEAVQHLAMRCHELLVCDGMSRTDMIVTDAGPILLETNTIPGMTSNSLLPRAAAGAGIAFGPLLDRLLDLACQRHAPRMAAGAEPATPATDGDAAAAQS